MSFKKAKVVMLPTNEKADICLNYNKLTLNQTQLINYTQSWQHLYFLSDEEIKEGDWFLSNLNEILKCTKREDKFIWYEKLTVPGVSKVAHPFSIHINLKPKKIIATTDKSLSKTIKSSYVQFGDNVEETRIEFLPQPSQSFIEKFVDEYNKSNVITEAMVEYEEKPVEELHDMYSIEHERNQRLKVNPKDNTITIRKMKDSWNREEVIQLLKRLAEDIDENYRPYTRDNSIGFDMVNNVIGSVCTCTNFRETPMINGKHICSVCNKTIAPRQTSDKGQNRAGE